MTVDDHTAAKAAQAVTSGIADLHEMIAAGYFNEVNAEHSELAKAMLNLGNLITFLNLIKDRKVA